jgi:ATP-dependent DNA ligase
MMVLAGEYLNKNQLGENGQDINKSFVIWDILGYEDKWLIGQTTESRLTLLETFFPCNRMIVNSNGLSAFNHLCCTPHDGIFKSPTYMHSFKTLYDDIEKTPLYEGLVLKKRSSKLEYGFNEANNTSWQLKCRKETKNYKF